MFVSVCLPVTSLAQKEVDGFGWNCAWFCRCHSGQGKLINFWCSRHMQGGPINRTDTNFFRKYAIPRPGSSESDLDEILYCYNLYFRQNLYCGSSW